MKKSFNKATRDSQHRYSSLKESEDYDMIFAVEDEELL